MALASHRIAAGEAGEATDADELRETVHYFCGRSRGRVATLCRETRRNADGEGYRLARRLMGE